MNNASVVGLIASFREEIALILNQERFYRTRERPSFEEKAAHTRREARLHEIRVELEKLQRREMDV